MSFINKLDKLILAERLYDDVCKEESCFKISDLRVDGYDIMNLGYTGKQIGQILKLLLDAVVNEEVQNNHDRLLYYVNQNANLLTN
jgi:tRNA nucleotidyltransferase (CCA-adding enzyme)